jgi:hypothetical protein
VLQAGAHHDAGYCRFKLTATVRDQYTDLFAGATVYFALSCSPSGNAALSSTTATSNASGVATVYLQGSSHCTGSVKAYACDDADCSSTSSAVTYEFVSGTMQVSSTEGAGTGSGSWSITGNEPWHYYYDYAGFTFDGGSTYHGGSGPDSPCSEENIEDELGGQLVYGWTETQVSDPTETCSAEMTALVTATKTATWSKDTLSGSGVPLGYFYRLTTYAWGYAEALGAGTSTQGLGGITPAPSRLAEAAGVDSPYDYVSEWDDTTPEHVQDVTISSASSEASRNLKAHSSSTSDRSSTGTTNGYSEAGNQVSIVVLHTHTNPA